VAGGVLAVVVSAAFAVVLLAIVELRDSARLARHSDEVLAAGNHLERLVIDLETGVRGFLMTGDERFLSPWTNARAAFPQQAQLFERLAAARDAGQGSRAQDIARAGASYIDGYSVPTVEAARRALAMPESVTSRLLAPSSNLSAILDEGRRRVDDLRRQFDGFATVEHRLAVARQERADTAARRATVAATVGIAGSLLVVGLFTDYLTRTIVRPVRRAATMAGRLAAGDLAVRLPETGAAEVGALEQAFNTMGSSLETNHRDLRLLLEEQAGLRRVATLVARAVPPAELFEAVTREIAAVLEAPFTILLRGGADDMATIAARWGSLSRHLPIGHPYPLEEGDPAFVAWRTGRAVRIESYADHSGSVMATAQRLGLRYGVAAPIVVDGRLWGLVGAAWTEPGRLPDGIEGRLTQFTELVATAIGNADSRAELSASRRRVVAAADETRRQIERDLHDGTQQRLVSLALDLRGAEAAVPSDLVALKGQLARVTDGLSDAVDELREVSRGIHPAILSKGGLGAALKMLVRRSSVPVTLVVPEDRRLPDGVEVALYYVASEALTNVAKHAGASAVHIELEAGESLVRLVVRDDGVGGAGPERGSGLIGLRDRIEALGGTIGITSPEGQGTTLRVEIRPGDR
jgi:signal transduction histidine kinase/CHASE3 domain sensor protein